MIRKHFKKIVVLSLFFLLVGGFGIKHAVSKGKPGTPVWISMTVTGDITGLEEGRCNRISDKTSGLVVGPMHFDLSYFKNVMFKRTIDGEPDGGKCFSMGTYNSAEEDTRYYSLVVSKKDRKSVV